MADLIHAVAEILNRTSDPIRAVQATLDRVAEHFGLEAGWVWLREAETGVFFKAAERGLPPVLREPVRMTGAPCTCLDELRAGRLTPRNIDVLRCSRLQAAHGRGTAGLAYHASIPLQFGERALGVMNLAGPEDRRLREDELHLLKTVAYLLGTALERSRLAEEAAASARARERSRLAREIHDVLAQGLTAIALYLESALGAGPEKARERLERALELTRETLEEARRSVSDLRSAALSDRPLPEALATLARRFTADTGIPVRLRTRGERELPLKVEAELLRIAQEALANVRRHSGARSAELRLQAAPEKAILTLKDDGHGFLPSAKEGHGLHGIRERVRLLDGRLRLASKPGRGTTVSVTVPLP